MWLPRLRPALPGGGVHGGIALGSALGGVFLESHVGVLFEEPVHADVHCVARFTTAFCTGALEIFSLPGAYLEGVVPPGTPGAVTLVPGWVDDRSLWASATLA